MDDWLRYFVGGSLWFFVCGFALWRGERPERTAAAAILIGMLATPLFQMRPLVNNTDFGVMVVDLAVLAVFIHVALRSDRWWPLFLAAFHLIPIAVHVVKLARPDTSHYVYVSARMLFGYLTLLAVLGGVLALEFRRIRGRLTQVRA